ncbi:hypothetical protein ACEN2I_07030 [Flavobacterium sp. W22_SRS_FK3]
MKTKALALMRTASFCGGVRYKRYSGQQEQLLILNKKRFNRKAEPFSM